MMHIVRFERWCAFFSTAIVSCVSGGWMSLPVLSVLSHSPKTYIAHRCECERESLFVCVSALQSVLCLSPNVS